MPDTHYYFSMDALGFSLDDSRIVLYLGPKIFVFDSSDGTLIHNFSGRNISVSIPTKNYLIYDSASELLRIALYKLEVIDFNTGKYVQFDLEFILYTF